LYRFSPLPAAFRKASWFQAVKTVLETAEPCMQADALRNLRGRVAGLAAEMERMGMGKVVRAFLRLGSVHDSRGQ
jgi:hypothetical protein